jgi:hypothetical protein
LREVQDLQAGLSSWTDPFIIRVTPRRFSASIVRPGELLKITIGLGLAGFMCNLWTFEPVTFLLCFLVTKLGLDHIGNDLSATYLRIGPGWLERVRFTVLKEKASVELFLPLSGARLVCRFDERKLHVFPNKRESCTIHDSFGMPSVGEICIDLREISKPHAFVHAVFRAGMSSEMAPRLPRNALTG